MDYSHQQDSHTIADEATLRSLFGETHSLAKLKSLPELDEHSRAFISRSPFLCLSTHNAAGKADVSPRGDPPGFVTILDDHTLAIPDRPGNNRLDSLSNILANPSVGMLFLIPGFDETLRVNGNARLSNNPALLESMAVNKRLPKLAIIIAVEEVFLHCAKAFRRSKLWQPEHQQDRSELPSLAKMVLEQTTGAPEDSAEMEKFEAELRCNQFCHAIKLEINSRHRTWVHGRAKPCFIVATINPTRF